MEKAQQAHATGMPPPEERVLDRGGRQEDASKQDREVGVHRTGGVSVVCVWGWGGVGGLGGPTDRALLASAADADAAPCGRL